VDGLHVQGVPEDEGEAFSVAEVGEPVPAEEALAADDEVVAEGGDGVEEGGAVRRDGLLQADVAVVVKEAERQGPGVEIDAAVESVLLGVEAHHGPRGLRGGLIPQRGGEEQTP
jgi:hypothetical protein